MLQKIINILKIIILAILNFLSSLFGTTKKTKLNKNTEKKKTNNSNINIKDNIIIPDDTITNKNFPTSNIDYDLIFNKIIKELDKSIKTTTKEKIIENKKNIIEKVKEKNINNTTKIKEEMRKIIKKEIKDINKQEKQDDIKETKEVIREKEKKQTAIDDKSNTNINTELLNISNPIIEKISSKKILKDETKQDSETINNQKENTTISNDKDTDINKVIEIKDVKIEYETITKQENYDKTPINDIVENNNINNNEQKNELNNKDTKAGIEEQKNKEVKKDLSKYIKKFNTITNDIIEKINNELQAKELNEEEYNTLIELVTDSINKQKLFININELNEKELNSLNNNINKLENTKRKIKLHKNNEIEKYNNELSQTISDEEKNKVNELLIELQQDYKNDLLKLNINNIEDLNNKTNLEIKEIEKKLLMIKLNKALKCAELPSIIALPFIRNRFFAFFTAGLFVHNHLTDLLFFNNRKERTNNTINMNNIINGANALDNSISITEENLNNLEYLKQDYLNKYPELIDNLEFMKSFDRLESKLVSNYNKLINKKYRFEKTKNKAIKINKKINPKKLLKTKRV